MGILDLYWRWYLAGLYGLACGHPHVTTAYKGELSGLSSILYMFNYICHCLSLAKGSTTVYCDNTSTLAEIFCKPYVRPTLYRQLQSDIDLLTCSRYLLSNSPSNVILQHYRVKGHYKGSNKQL